MSEGNLRVAIEQMEAWMADPSWEPDPEALAEWHTRFQAAVAPARTSEGWTDLVARAHALGPILEVRTMQLTRLRDEIRAELDAQERGNRALRGYGASSR